VGCANESIGEREDQRGVAERVGNGEPGDEQAGHRREDDEPHGPLLRIHDAREPRVADPAPPQNAEDEHPLGDARPRRLGRHERRALRQRKDEDEVEEELERRDRLPLARHGRQAAAARSGVRAHAGDLVM
jgi:hypothetical protein